MDKPFAKPIYEFENFRLDASQLMLSRYGEDMALPPKAIETLLVLVERRGKVVSKDDLLEEVWHDSFVQESNLYGYLHMLRSALGDQENGKPFVETLRRRGYRFNGEVRVVGEDTASHDVFTPTQTVDPDVPKTSHKSRKIVLGATGSIGLALLATVGFTYVNREKPTEEVANVSPQHIENAEVRGLCIRGHDLLQRLTPDNYKQAIASFEEAKALDPNDACSYVGIATANRVNMLAADAPPVRMMPSARENALKGVTLAPDLAEAQIALGMITFFHDWDWKQAREQLNRGYNLKPDSEDTNIQLAHFYSNMGEHDEAVRLSKYAVDLEPDKPRTAALHGMILFHARRYDEAIEFLKKSIKFKPDFWLFHFNLQRAYIAKHMYAEALREGELARKYNSASLEILAQKAYAYAMMGNIKQSRRALAELQKVKKGKYVGPYLFAVIYNGLGDTQKALASLEEAYDIRDWRMTFLKVDPRLDNLRTEPRFIALMQKVKFDS